MPLFVWYVRPLYVCTQAHIAQMARISSSLALLCGLFHGAALVSGDELALGTVGNIEVRPFPLRSLLRPCPMKSRFDLIDPNVDRTRSSHSQRLRAEV